MIELPLVDYPPSPTVEIPTEYSPPSPTVELPRQESSGGESSGEESSGEASSSEESSDEDSIPPPYVDADVLPPEHGPQEHRDEDAARIWLVNQLGATLFASKSGGYHTTVYWIGMLEDLGRVCEYAWGAIALATLYDQLSRASRRGTAQMGGFSSLLLGWVYEYLSDRVIIRRADPEYSQDQPRARRWVTSRVPHAGLDERRVMLDELTVDDIIWTPFEDHRADRPRDPRAMYSGYIRSPFGRVVRRHLPERVLRQFGYIQDVPRHPSEIQTTGSLAETTDAAYAEFEPHLRPQGIPATYPGEAVEDYMRWYSAVSHRFIIPDDRREEFSAVTVMRRAVDLLEQSLEVPDAPAVGTHSRSLTERALDLIRSNAFIGTQGVAFATVRGARAAGGRDTYLDISWLLI
ncbi:protein MAINTENANCE OF MERISTEMS-like [Lotus japonicus]|uniref:protein MAINTENANCE OF MERISTEMS-like n=1 Tax=Lotus japonicus TaxID=34305 RepID=UPI00258AADCE|nr:protein MAINTENANCE OF MERISTEMS-like [Lotus japonicus]